MIECDDCNEWFHIDCIRLERKIFNRIRKTGEHFACNKCASAQRELEKQEANRIRMEKKRLKEKKKRAKDERKRRRNERLEQLWEEAKRKNCVEVMKWWSLAGMEISLHVLVLYWFLVSPTDNPVGAVHSLVSNGTLYCRL